MKLYPDFVVSTLAIHRLLAIILVISAKLRDDTYYDNAYYAIVCGLSLLELNALEVEFLNLIHWKIAVFPQEYKEYAIMPSPVRWQRLLQP